MSDDGNQSSGEFVSLMKALLKEMGNTDNGSRIPCVPRHPPSSTRRPGAEKEGELALTSAVPPKFPRYRTKKKPCGRKAIPIKYIIDKTRRNVTQSKRKNGVLKKAWELAELTGTETLVALMYPSGRVYLTWTRAWSHIGTALRDPNNPLMRCARENCGGPIIHKLEVLNPDGTFDAYSTGGPVVGGGGGGESGGTGAGGKAGGGKEWGPWRQRRVPRAQVYHATLADEDALRGVYELRDGAQLALPGGQEFKGWGPCCAIEWKPSACFAQEACLATM